LRTFQMRERSMLRQCAIRMATVAMIALAAFASSAWAREPIVLLDEDWDVELTWRGTSAEPVAAEEAAAEIPSGQKALRISNENGAPQLRIRDAEGEVVEVLEQNLD